MAIDWEKAAESFNSFSDTALEGLWKGVKALGDWFGIGTTVNYWINDARDKKYGYKDVIDKLLSKIDNLPIPQNDTSKLQNYLSRLQNSVFSIDGKAARIVGDRVKELEGRLDNADKKYSAAVQARDAMVNQATRKINEMQDLADSGNLWVDDKFQNLAKETERILSNVQ